MVISLKGYRWKKNCCSLVCDRLNCEWHNGLNKMHNNERGIINWQLTLIIKYFELKFHPCCYLLSKSEKIVCTANLFFFTYLMSQMWWVTSSYYQNTIYKQTVAQNSTKKCSRQLNSKFLHRSALCYKPFTPVHLKPFKDNRQFSRSPSYHKNVEFGIQIFPEVCRPTVSTVCAMYTNSATCQNNT